jgi:hypothetical protein
VKEIVQKTLILADAHVHIYSCFELTQLFNSALRNFNQSAAKLKKNINSPYSAILFLTETSQDNYFDYLNALAKADGQLFPKWKIEKTQEDCSLLLQNPSEQFLYLIAGRQIVTAENLEVLGLTINHKLEDGQPIRNVIEDIIASGGIPVIPWGFGKWMAGRGTILEKLLTTHHFPYLFLGDNSGRPKFWSKPYHFQLAQKQGIKILPGSDSLPFASEAHRSGSFGFAVDGKLDPKFPAQSIKEILLKSTVELKPYGLPENPYRFIRNQVFMQLVKRQRAK